MNARRNDLEEEEGLDLARALRASRQTSSQLLTLYIPNKDRKDHEFGTQRRWVLQAAALLARIGGGVTILPAAEGGWLDPKGKIIWEAPVLVYTYIQTAAFLEQLPVLREFLHRLGRETDQGEVVIEFDGRFYRIRRPFDAAKEARHAQDHP